MHRDGFVVPEQQSAACRLSRAPGKNILLAPSWVYYEVVSPLTLWCELYEDFFDLSVSVDRVVSERVVLSGNLVLVGWAPSYYIVDWIFGQLTLFLPYLIPITLGTFGVFYAYILMTLPYSITPKRALPSLIPIGLAILIYYLPNILQALAS